MPAWGRSRRPSRRHPRPASPAPSRCCSRRAAAGGRIAGMGWRMRPYVPAADREWVKELWSATLPPSWPPLAAGIATLRDGLVAEAGADPVGLAAVDMAGSIPLILVHPAHQRR